MERSLRVIEVGPTGPDVAGTLLAAVREALDGTGPALAPRPPAVARERTEPQPGRAPDDTVLVVRTSGSSGPPRDVVLGREALLTSARATHERLGGPGRWILTLPLTHVAGLQVLVRSVVAGTDPVTVAADGGFRAEVLADAVTSAVLDPAAGAAAGASAGRLYTSVVPTQLHRVVAAAEGGALPERLASLRRLDAILVGGAAAGGPLLERARELGLRVVTTYGMTETCGGCVYDGVPLTGTRVAVVDGVVRLAGPMLAHGYAGTSEDPDGFVTDATGVRWFVTRDLGVLAEGRLRVLGRADDVVVTGGEKVSPTAVEEVVVAVPGVREVCVVGIPDAEWGQMLVAVVVPVDPTRPPALEAVRAAVARTLGVAAAPRRLLVVDALPERGPGKVDRARTARTARTAALAAGRPGRPD
ncbi:MAG: hypothetical protein JWP95_786 [Actinotalea sp.]|nr:hypothetical protein [Actinotalea sp.]